METKQCWICKTDLPEEAFSSSRWKAKCRSIRCCKECRAKETQDRYEKYPDYNKSYYQENSLKVKENRRKRYQKNSEKERAYRKEHYRKNYIPLTDGFKSHLERSIAEFLDSIKVSYIKEQAFNGCVNKNQLFFDFYLPAVNLVIEVHGQQHYEPVEHFGGQTSLDSCRKRDRKKFLYTDNHEISYLEIPYWLFENIDKVKELIIYHLKLLQPSILLGISA